MRHKLALSVLGLGFLFLSFSRLFYSVLAFSEAVLLQGAIWVRFEVHFGMILEPFEGPF